MPWEEDARDRLRADISDFFRQALSLFAQHGFPARTYRFMLTPVALTCEHDRKRAHESIAYISQMCASSSIRWFCVPFYTAGQNLEKVNAFAHEVVERYNNAFVNYIVAGAKGIDMQGITAAAAFIKSVSGLSDNGFDNFRCGVSCNIKADGAYFPFSYNGGASGFAVALEMVPLCIALIQSQHGLPLDHIRETIVETLVPLLQKVEGIAKTIAQKTGMRYFGIDASFAPHPEHPDHSVARMIELLGIARCGCSGTVFATGFLTDIIKTLIKKSGIQSTGFNGVMFSVLEDPRLGEVSAAPNTISIDSLLAYATMCGCGIDMVPVPGDMTEAEIASVILDVAAVALRLDKPLGIRLLPVPGKRAGEMTTFNHDFLHNTKVQNILHHNSLAVLSRAEKLFRFLA